MKIILLSILCLYSITQSEGQSHFRERYENDFLPDGFGWQKFKRPFDQDAYFEMLNSKPKRPTGLPTSYQFLEDKDKRAFSVRLFMDRLKAQRGQQSKRAFHPNAFLVSLMNQYGNERYGK